MKNKFVKFFKVLLLVFVILLLLPVVYFWAFGFIYKGSSDDGKIAYLQKHQLSLKENCTITDTTLFSEVNKTSVFLFGEEHGYSRTQIFDAELLKYLNKKFGVRDYFNETFSEDADLLNKFLSTNPMDLSILRKTIPNLKEDIPQRKNQEYVDKWVSIYQYNQTLPSDKRIKVYGLLGAKKDYKGGRDSVMIENFKRYQKEVDKSASLYCSTGYGHILQNKINDHLPFAGWLKSNKYPTVSIAHISINSMMYMPKGYGMPVPDSEETDWANVNGPMVYFENIVNVDKACSSSIALFRLDGSNSPYRGCLDLVRSHSALSFVQGEMIPENGKSTSDYYQYIFVTKNLAGPRKLK